MASADWIIMLYRNKEWKYEHINDTLENVKTRADSIIDNDDSVALVEVWHKASDCMHYDRGRK